AGEGRDQTELDRLLERADRFRACQLVHARKAERARLVAERLADYLACRDQQERRDIGEEGNDNEPTDAPGVPRTPGGGGHCVGGCDVGRGRHRSSFSSLPSGPTALGAPSWRRSSA